MTALDITYKYRQFISNEALDTYVSSIWVRTNYYLRRIRRIWPLRMTDRATGSDVTGPDRKSRCDVTEGHVTPWVRACATGFPALFTGSWVPPVRTFWPEVGVSRSSGAFSPEVGVSSPFFRFPALFFRKYVLRMPRFSPVLFPVFFHRTFFTVHFFSYFFSVLFSCTFFHVLFSRTGSDRKWSWSEVTGNGPDPK